jgi:hypothetical protein
MCRAIINADQSNTEEADWPQVFIPINIVAGDFFGTHNLNLPTWGPILIKGKWFIKGEK